jgi:hypothetical protein
MMRRRFVRHPRGYAGYRPVGLRNYDQLSTTVGVLPDDEHDLPATGMERVVNPPLDQVLAGSMSLLRAASGSRGCRSSGRADLWRSYAAACKETGLSISAIIAAAWQARAMTSGLKLISGFSGSGMLPTPRAPSAATEGAWRLGCQFQQLARGAFDFEPLVRVGHGAGVCGGGDGDVPKSLDGGG